MFINDPHTGYDVKNSYENLFLSKKAMTYSKAGDDLCAGREGGSLDEVSVTGTFENQLFRAT